MIADGAMALAPGVPGVVGLGIKASREAATVVDDVVEAAADVTKSSASSSVNAVKLEKQLASEEQLSQLANGGGTVINQPAKQAARIASETERNPANIQKVSSDTRIARDGQQIQTHSFRDASTNELIEPKTIINE